LRKLLGTIVRHSTHTKEKAHHERCGEKEDCCCSAGEVGEGEKNLGLTGSEPPVKKKVPTAKSLFRYGHP